MSGKIRKFQMGPVCQKKIRVGPVCQKIRKIRVGHRESKNSKNSPGCQKIRKIRKIRPRVKKFEKFEKFVWPIKERPCELYFRTSLSDCREFRILLASFAYS